MLKNAPFILYLDFDGVLHPDEVYRYVSYPHIRLEAEGHTLFEHVPVLERLLEPYPKLKIVLSTSWVSTFDFHRARKRLSPPLQGRVIGATYHTLAGYSLYEFKQMTRYQQIAQDLQRRNPLRWLAVDDDASQWPIHVRQHLVATPSFDALGSESAQKDLADKLSALFGDIGL